MPDLIADSDVEDYYGQARLYALIKGETADTHPKLDTAVTRGSSEMLSLIDRRYDPETFPTTIEPLKGHTCALVLDWYTRSLDQRSESIKDAAKVARSWAADVGAGKIDIAETEDSAVGDGGGGIRYEVPDSEFVLDDDEFAARFPDL